jgi:hypothetical protein
MESRSHPVVSGIPPVVRTISTWARSLDLASGAARPGVRRAASARDSDRRARGIATLPRVYALGFGFWLLTRLLVLVHQGAWPWMNSFVVAAARGIVVGDWNDAVRPQFPAVMGVPLVLAGATEQQTVAALYVAASIVQFVAFVILVRALWPGRMLEQGLALLIFLLVPYQHSIHHYRDMPVILASSAIFLMAAHYVTASRERITRRDVAIAAAAMLLGIWSRIEVLTFVVALIVLTLLIQRRAAWRVATAYAAVMCVVTVSLVVVYVIEGVDLPETSFYAAHTFLDSTPDSWLTEQCRDFATENCRERDGLSYFGPADPHDGLVPLIANHPLATLAKTARSAWDNLWVMFGPNLSTFPTTVPFLVLAIALSGFARDALKRIPPAVWIVSVAVMSETVFPPLTWAPPHPQYHLQLVLPVVAIGVPILVGLIRNRVGAVLTVTFFAANAGLSALRYTRYPGY